MQAKYRRQSFQIKKLILLNFHPTPPYINKKGVNKMGFWTAVAVISIVAIVMGSVLHIVKMGTRYSENVERIKRGYPTLDGSEPTRDEKEDRLQ